MDPKKRQRLEKAGWRVGDTRGFLGLSADEAAYIEMKVSLASAFAQRRKAMRLTQTTAAAKIGSSQSRVAKMEAGDTSVSLDLLVRSLLKLGAEASDLARVMTPAKRRRPARRAG